jgi:hypothetical protein
VIDGFLKIRLGGGRSGGTDGRQKNVPEQGPGHWDSPAGAKTEIEAMR